MKKLSTKCVVLLLVLSLFALMAMGSGSSTPSDVKTPSSVTTDGKAVPKSEETAKSTEPPKPSITVEEAVLVDEQGVKITVTGYEPDGMLGGKLKLLIENNSGKSLTVQARGVSVNGYMADTIMSVDVADGKKANDGLTFMTSSLERCGIKEIADMDFSFHIFDSVSWDTFFDTPQITVKTSAASSYKYAYDDSGDLVYNKDGIEIVIKGLVKDDSILGPGIRVYVNNSTSKKVVVQTRDVSINGFMVDTIFSTEVTPGKHALSDITFLSSDLEENGISDITDVELSFHIYDDDSWETIEDTEPVNIKFN